MHSVAGSKNIKSFFKKARRRFDFIGLVAGCEPDAISTADERIAIPDTLGYRDRRNEEPDVQVSDPPLHCVGVGARHNRRCHEKLLPVS